MALVVKDRVKETTATTGTGTLTLAGAVTGFQSFSSALSNGDTTYYSIFESSTGEWEVGLGTFTLSGTTLSRDTILESSNAGSAINLTAGAADVFITQPAEKAVYLDGSGNLSHTVALGTETSGNYVATIATNAGLDGSGSGEGSAVTLSLNLNELSTSITDGDGDYFVVVDTVGDQRKLTKANINISGFNNDAGYSTTVGTVTSVGGTGTVSGLTLTGTVTSSGNLTLGGTLAVATTDITGLTASATELNYNDITTLGTSQASKTVTADANGNILLSEEVQAKSYLETVVALSGTTPSVSCNAGNSFSLTTSGNTTFTFDYSGIALTTNDAYGFSLKLTAGGTHTITWPASVDWTGGTAPDAPASGETDVLVFWTVDGGTTWYGFRAGDAMA